MGNMYWLTFGPLLLIRDPTPFSYCFSDRCIELCTVLRNLGGIPFSPAKPKALSLSDFLVLISEFSLTSPLRCSEPSPTRMVPACVWLLPSSTGSTSGLVFPPTIHPRSVHLAIVSATPLEAVGRRLSKNPTFTQPRMASTGLP